MLSRLSIGMKVFALAVLLLCLTIALACFLLWHVTRLQGEMQVKHFSIKRFLRLGFNPSVT